MTEQMPRWDLSDLYPSMDSPELKKDMASVSAGALRFETHYKGKLAESTPDEFGKSIEEYERLNETLARGAHKMMSNLFAMDRYTLSLQENIDIFKAAYR